MPKSEADFFVVSGTLEPLREKLTIGERVKGRIIKKLCGDRYILRIWGYNFCMESQYHFREQQEIILMVNNLWPIIEFIFVPQYKQYIDPTNLRCNLIA